MGLKSLKIFKVSKEIVAQYKNVLKVSEIKCLRKIKQNIFLNVKVDSWGGRFVFKR